MALKSDFEHSSDINSPFVDEVANRHGTTSFGRDEGSPERRRKRAARIVRHFKTQKAVRRFLDERGTKAKVK
jgi:hypothetical protein